MFARGKAEEEIIKTQNDEWILCVTNFDTSAISQERLIVAEVITKKLVERLSGINYRMRISDEYAYYEETAWNRARASAAKAVATKQEERSGHIYRGDAGWIYRRNVARLDTDIEKLFLALEEIDENAPLINKEPLFGLTKDNLNFTFPAAPVSGNESRFCVGQNADGFIEGVITEFHGRFLVSIKLYTLYTRSYVWEEEIIFSHEDMESALDDIIRRLLIVLQGNQSSTVTIRSQPEDTLVLINRSFASRRTGTVLEYPPGDVTVSASAVNHENLTFDTQLLPGEHAEIEINLKQIEYMNVEISQITGGNVYHGALFVGETPLTLRLPVNKLEFIELEAPNSTRGSIVFQTSETPEYDFSLSLRMAMPPPKGRVDSSRRMFYWAWGATWLAGLTAWVTYQSYITASTTIMSNYNSTSYYNQQFYDDTMNMYNISMTALAVMGVAAVFDVIFFSRYLYTANRGATPILNTGRQ